MTSRQEAEQLIAWWNDDNLEKYVGKWIAFRKGEVFDSEQEIDALLKKIELEKKGENTYTIAYVLRGGFQ